MQTGDFAPAAKNNLRRESCVSKPTALAHNGSASVPTKPLKPQGKTLGKRITEHWQLYLLLLIPVIITIIYKNTFAC